MLKAKISKLIPEDLNNKERIERKQIETICDACIKLIQICNKKELKVADLKWQPHYSVVFKQLKTQLEGIVANDTSKSLDKLNTIPYLLALKNNIFSILNSFAKFIVESGQFIGIKDHHMRRSFFMRIVHFQFLCHEIQAYFPGGIYSPMKVIISKIPAKEWWLKVFGDTVFVDLDLFVNKFKEDYPLFNQAEIFSFKNSINFTSTNFTSKFEFDLFTRLYCPWEKIRDVWRIIYNHPAYLHFSTYGETKDNLSRHIDRSGTYVFRASCKDLGFWTIGYVKGSKDIGQIKVDKTSLIEALVEGHKKNMYLYPNGEFTNPDLTNLYDFRKEIVVNNEDLQLYGSFEDFKECKICREFEKDLQLESCGHQICQCCFKQMRKYNKKLCPFCNQMILSTTRIVNITDSHHYVLHNPARKDSPEKDDRYAHMSFHCNDTNGKDDIAAVESRGSEITRTTHPSIYSNASDDFTYIDSHLDTAPEAPPRPDRDKKELFKGINKFPEIKYPPMEKLRNSEVLSVQSRNHSAESREESSIYADMNSNTDGHASSIYAEMNSNTDGHASSIYADMNSNTDGHASSIYADINSNTACSKSPIHVENKLSAIGKVESHIKVDDIYCDVIDIEDSVDTVQDNQVNDIHGVDHDNNVLSSDVIYGNLCDEYCPTNVGLAADDDCDIYACPNEVVHSEVKGDMAVVHDDIYCDPCVEEPVVTDLATSPFHGWSAGDVARALRVARNDVTIARDILIEFVGLQ